LRRGSGKHVVDRLEQPGFLRELEALVADAPCRIPANARYVPRGYREPAETRPGLARQLPGIAIGVDSHDQLPNPPRVDADCDSDAC